jgi:hypothetical protein
VFRNVYGCVCTYSSERETFVCAMSFKAFMNVGFVFRMFEKIGFACNVMVYVLSLYDQSGENDDEC